MFHLIWVLIIGAIIGVIAGAITSRDMPMGWVGNIIAGLIGSWLGEMLLGTWGPNVAGMAIFPSIVGAIILVLIVSFIMGATRKNK
ncbi:GlsB/YeaQ/YmgE family stress response membrane protein [Secundilactobacillus malefermentans]|uniref:GlsB/YeaQ/YmgE family stress response membrane protein n=1 Tax=Secundilactobacillus malefermentans TaxID=176292 RepID=UPI0011C92DE4|nr:GlsB/YeaQ/YmgE family stress response membrane protein [Secundilactobacillus malefermentans]QEA31776.1 GlsB/YeaQ/YmgE family stress response membrane protein [Secundilactobacillus malefermentans]